MVVEATQMWAGNDPGKLSGDSVRSGFVPFTPLGKGFLTGKMNAETEFRLPQRRAALLGRGTAGQPGIRRPAAGTCHGEERHAGTGGARLAAVEEGLDRVDSGHHHCIGSKRIWGPPPLS